jgi:hypothetical protein
MLLFKFINFEKTQINEISLYNSIGTVYLLFGLYQYKLYNKLNEFLVYDFTDSILVSSYKNEKIINFNLLFFLLNNYYFHCTKNYIYLICKFYIIHYFFNPIKRKKKLIKTLFLDFDIVYFEIFLFLNIKKYIYRFYLSLVTYMNFSFFFIYLNFFLLGLKLNFFLSQNKFVNVSLFKVTLKYFCLLKNIQILPYWMLRSQHTVYGNCELGQRVRSSHFFSYYTLLDFFQLKTYNNLCHI